MEKRGGVDEFHDSGQYVPTVICVSAVGPSKQEDQNWPQTLAAPRDDIVRHGSYQSNFRMQSVADDLIDRRQIFCDRWKKLVGVGGCCGSGSQGGLR
jgi:hypothetical protein